MKTMTTLAIAVLALGLVAAKAPSASHATKAADAMHVQEVIGAKTPMPDFFGSMLVVR